MVKVLVQLPEMAVYENKEWELFLTRGRRLGEGKMQQERAISISCNYAQDVPKDPTFSDLHTMKHFL